MALQLPKQGKYTYGYVHHLPRLYRLAKRIIDVVGSLIGLAVIGLLLPWLALAIWGEDRGPIFYQQVRLGLYGRPFMTYKFRSMIVEAERYLDQHPQLDEAWRQGGKLQDDPRVTRIGRFLRRTSLDELPQMLNVLRGEMSLVGPRAIQCSEARAFGELAELRQMMKPGVTGLWQVSGRSTTDYEQRCVLDCTYIMECSLGIDLYILCKTLPAVVHGLGAY